MLNFHTGHIIPIESQDVKTPVGELNTNKIIMNKAGFYEFSNQTISANLLSFEESNVNAKMGLSSPSLNLSSVQSTTRHTDLSSILIMAALAVMIIELFIVKWRGDL